MLSSLWRLLWWAPGDRVSESWLLDRERRQSYQGVERHTGSIKMPIVKHKDEQGPRNRWLLRTDRKAG